MSGPGREEAALTCAACTKGHGAQLAKPCGTFGCECFCNRSAKPPERLRVTFQDAFRGGARLCISHVSVDGVKTLCGRSLATAEERIPDPGYAPDCLTCRRVEARQ